jgi:hypothetical protein
VLPGGRGHGGPRKSRVGLLAVATAAAFLGIGGTASAATYLVDEATGTDAGDCTVSPCATIGYAIDQHRLDPDPGDVIEVVEGTYPENVDATDPADDGLLIRGELTSGGHPATEITGEGDLGAGGCPDCIVALGAAAPSNIEVKMQNVAVTQDGIDPDAELTPVFLDGGSDLETVDATVTDDGTWAAVEYCDEPGSVIDDVIVDTRGTDTDGISGCAAITIEDSLVFTDDAPALHVGGDPAEDTEITRSWMSASPNGSLAVLELTGGFVLDSSLVTGGSVGVGYNGDPPGTADIDLNNSTVDAADPGIDDAEALFLGRSGTAPIEATVDSTILVDQLFVDDPGADLTLSCDHSNFTSISTPANPSGFTDDCPPAGDPGSTNTATDVADLFEDPAGDDWTLQPGSPAIDAGRPGPVPPGLSQTDFDDNPRRVPGTAATCPDGVRDQGAFEAATVSCPPTQRTLTVTTGGTGGGTVTGPGIDCGGSGHTDCSEAVPVGTSIRLTAAPAAGSTFAGYFGGGCSANPCSVTLDSSKLVEARFADGGAQTLRVELGGRGRGLVTGPGIDCGNSAGHADCGETYSAGEQVTLTAVPEKGSLFAGFSGGSCSASPCTLTMDGPQSVVAGFDPTTAPTTSFTKRPRKPWPTEPAFRLRSSEEGSTFECKVDEGDWEACGARVKLRGLDRGRHKFRARATNPAGVTGPHASAGFRIPG